MYQQLQNTIAHISPVNKELIPKAQAHLDNLTKPQGSLARLEDVAKRLYCIQDGPKKLCADPACMFTVAGDHGIVAEKVASFPQEVTRQMVQNILAGGAGISVLCKSNAIDLQVVDAGCVGGAFPPHSCLIDKRLGHGTKNFAKEPAMTHDTCIEALCHGIDIATEAAGKGYKILGIGEMGIGNTTPATALFCAYLDLAPKNITGPGAGASPEAIHHKALVIDKALALHGPILKKKTQKAKEASEHAIDILATVGGFEIAIMAGMALGAAKQRMILMVDGFISTAAFTAALHICPAVADYAILSHASAEPGYTHVIKALESKQCDALPLLHLGLRLGEGTGAALAVPLVRAAAAIFNDMATFSQAQVTGEPCQH